MQVSSRTKNDLAGIFAVVNEVVFFLEMMLELCLSEMTEAVLVSDVETCQMMSVSHHDQTRSIIIQPRLAGGRIVSARQRETVTLQVREISKLSSASF